MSLFHDSGCRPTPRPVPAPARAKAQTDLPPPSLPGRRHALREGNQPGGKGCAPCVWFREERCVCVCIVNKGGIDCCSCARTSPSYSRLSDPTSDDLTTGALLGKGTGSWEEQKEQQAAAVAASTPPARARHPSPTRFSHPTASRHQRQTGTRGEARRGNVRQCKARQGNKEVLAYAPPPPAAPIAAAPASSPTVLAQCAAFGTRGARGRGTTTRRAGLPVLLPSHTTRDNDQASIPLPRFRAVVRALTASSRIIHCVNHALHFFASVSCNRDKTYRETERLPDRSRWLATALPCPPPSPAPVPVPLRHPGGSCRSLQDRGKKRGPCQPCACHPGWPGLSTPKEGPQPADRPTAIGERRSFSFSSRQEHKSNNVLPSSSPPASRLSRPSGVRRYPWREIWGARKPGKWDTLPARALGSWNNTHPSPSAVVGHSVIWDESFQPTPPRAVQFTWQVTSQRPEWPHVLDDNVSPGRGTSQPRCLSVLGLIILPCPSIRLSVSRSTAPLSLSHPSHGGDMVQGCQKHTPKKSYSISLSA